MTRQPVLFFAATALLAVFPALASAAVELPNRKPGLWEIKMTRVGSALPGMTMQHCTDETTDKQMTSTFAPMAKDVCSKNDTVQTATGYTVDSACSSNGTSIITHAEIAGDFNAAYTVKTSSHSQGGAVGAARDTTMTLEAKWLGACKADQKAGDIVMPGGFKMNIKDMEKLKGMMPK
jgi:Protein of unknown function (DUF3617)